jgi:phenylpyruvate tautomerase
MPLVTVYTSVEPPADEKLNRLRRDLSSTTARLIGKSESYVMTCLVPSAHLTFGGSFDPSCLVEVKSIGGLGGDVPAHLWGFDGATIG